MPPQKPAALDLKTLCAALNACLSPRLGAALSVSAEWPAFGSTAPLPRETGVTVRLGLGAASNAPELCVWLDAALATNLVDRALGGRGELGIVTSAAQLSQAECGVLAYLAARVAQALPPSCVREVSTLSTGSVDLEWPIRVRLGETTGAARIGLSQLPAQTLPCWLAFREELSDADANALAPGDLLTLDQLPLTLTTQGLIAPCLLVSPELDSVLPVLLDGGELRASGRAVSRRAQANETWLVAHTANLTLWDLASLASGAALKCAVDPSASFTLVHRQTPVARGVLVRHQGKLALEVEDRP